MTVKLSTALLAIIAVLGLTAGVTIVTALTVKELIQTDRQIAFTLSVFRDRIEALEAKP